MKNMPKLSQNLTIKIFIGLIGLYLGISALAAQILSTPKRVFDSKASQVFSLNPQEISFFTADDIEIAGWFAPFSDSDKAIILVHGMNSSRSHEFDRHFPEFASGLQNQGFSILMIDLRGHGKSSNARFTFGITERKDVLGAVNCLQRKGFKPEKIGILGVSMGGAAAIGAISENDNIGALVVDSTYAEVYPVMQHSWTKASGLPNFFLPTAMIFANCYTGYNLRSSQPVSEIRKISHVPILIIHSIYDPFISVEQSQQLKNASSSSQYWETKARKHPENYNHNPKIYVEKVATFFYQYLK